MAQDPYKYFRVEARELVDQLAQGRARAREGRRRRGCGAAAAAPRAHAQGRGARRQAAGDRRPGARDRGRAGAVPRCRAERRARADRRHPGASRRDQPASSRRWRRPRLRRRRSQAPQRQVRAPRTAARTVRADIAEIGRRARRRGGGACAPQWPARQRPRRGAGAASGGAAAGAARPARGSRPRPAIRRRQPPLGRSSRSCRRKFGGIERSLGHDHRSDGPRAAPGARRGGAAAAGPGGQRSSPRSSGPRATPRRRSASSVAFEGRGGDVRLDAHVLETVQGALIQIVRNAVAHGIETGGRARGRGQAGRRARVASTSPGAGGASCSSAATTAAASTSRPCAAVALQRGLLGRTADRRSTPQELVAPAAARRHQHVGDRHRGLRARHRPRRRARGASSGSAARSWSAPSPGAGTTIELVVPLSLASVEALVVETEAAGGSRPPSPLDAVRSTLRAAGERDLARRARRLRSSTSEKAIPFVPLATALDRHALVAGAAAGPAVIVAGADGHRRGRRRPPAGHRRASSCARCPQLVAAEPDRGGRVARCRGQSAARARSRRARGAPRSAAAAAGAIRRRRSGPSWSSTTR